MDEHYEAWKDSTSAVLSALASETRSVSSASLQKVLE
jgi:hypothetical protein